jgi:Holliday junction DNA helicase RuvA
VIEFLKGRIALKYSSHVVIENGGMGITVWITEATYAKIEPLEECKLHTHFSVSVDVRSGSSEFKLFGFFTEGEREIFRALIEVSGVSATIARTILSSVTVEELTYAITTQDPSVLKKAKGVGPKLAEKIVLGLKGKVFDVNISETFSSVSSNTIADEALSALLALGFDKIAARKSINKILLNANTEMGVEDLIKEALRQG